MDADHTNLDDTLPEHYEITSWMMTVASGGTIWLVAYTEHIKTEVHCTIVYNHHKCSRSNLSVWCLNITHGIKKITNAMLNDRDLFG